MPSITSLMPGQSALRRVPLLWQHDGWDCFVASVFYDRLVKLALNLRPLLQPKHNERRVTHELHVLLAHDALLHTRLDDITLACGDAWLRDPRSHASSSALCFVADPRLRLSAFSA